MCFFALIWKYTYTQTHTHTHIHTQRHKAHSEASRLIHPLIHPYKYIFKFIPPVMSFSSYLYYIEWLIHWYEKFTFHNVFSFQKFHPLYKGVVGGGGSNYVFLVLGPVLFYFSFAKWELLPWLITFESNILTQNFLLSYNYIFNFFTC